MRRIRRRPLFPFQLGMERSERRLFLPCPTFTSDARHRRCSGWLQLRTGYQLQYPSGKGRCGHRNSGTSLFQLRGQLRFRFKSRIDSRQRLQTDVHQLQSHSPRLGIQRRILEHVKHSVHRLYRRSCARQGRENKLCSRT